ncbi:MAG: NAD-dependent epimerase/dehydratase family protein [Chloroflexota bacterium]
METVLVTGGAGFIGSHIVDALIKQGFRVVVVDNLSAGKRENVNPEAVFRHLNIGSAELADVFTKDKIDWVSHHAAQIDVRRSVDDPPQDARVNILGLLNLLGNCLRHRVRGVVFASSGGVVYGEPDAIPVAETFPKRPLSPYGVAKLSAEYYLYYYHRVKELSYIALRYSNVYGPRQDPTGEAGVASIFGGRMLAGQTPTIFGDGRQQRDYVFVADVVKANLLALKMLAGLPPPASLDDNAYNIGTGTGISVNELFDRLKETTGFDKVARYAAARTGELNKMVLDISKAGSGLSWQPTVSLPDGLGELVGYLRGRIGKTWA